MQNIGLQSKLQFYIKTSSLNSWLWIAHFWSSRAALVLVGKMEQLTYPETLSTRKREFPANQCDVIY